MIRFLLVMLMSHLCAAHGYDNHLRRETSIKVPKPFIITTTLGVNSSGKDKSNIVQFNNKMPSNSNLTLKKNHDRRKDNDKFYNFQKDNMKKFITSSSANNNSPKINFYQMNCAVGQKCSAVIPGPRTPLPPPKYQTDDEMRTYLKRHGLDKGFNYSNKDRVNKNSVVARYFEDEEEKRRKARKERNGRKISSFMDLGNFWPGSEYRPNKIITKAPYHQSKSKVYKYGINSSSNRPDSNSWTKVQSPSSYNYGNDFGAEKGRPSSNFPNFKSNIRPHSTSYNPKSKGDWTRFSNSLVTKYDKNRDDWVEVSSSNVDLGAGFVNADLKPANHYQDNPNSHHAGVGLTVFGIGENSDPFYNQSPTRSTYRPKYTPIQSSHYPQHHDRPSPPSYSPPSKPNSVSFPLNVYGPELSDPVLVFSNDGSNTGTSLDDESDDGFNIFHKPISPFDYSDYTDLTLVNFTKPAINKTIASSPTIKPTIVTRVVVQTQNSPPSSQQQQSSSSGNGDGGGSLINNAYAVMAAVGAGLIPASIVAILPVLLGKKRRRRSLGGSWETSSYLSPLDGRKHPDSVYRFIQKNNFLNRDVHR